MDITYTNNNDQYKNELIFLNDKNLVLTDTTETSIPTYNPVPSYKLFKEKIDDINSTISGLDGKIVTETTRATEAESILDKKITDEIDRATEAESELDSKISTETARVDSIESELDSKITDETTRATEAESILDKKITDEIDRAKAAEAELDSKITDETTRATEAESGLDKKITDEIDRAKAAEQANAKAISDEIARAEDVEAEINTNIQNISTDYLSKSKGGIINNAVTFRNYITIDGNIRSKLLSTNNSENIITINGAGDTKTGTLNINFANGISDIKINNDTLFNILDTLSSSTQTDTLNHLNDKISFGYVEEYNWSTENIEKQPAIVLSVNDTEYPVAVSSFIKDNMLSTVDYDDVAKRLIFTFNDEKQIPISVDVKDFINIYKDGVGLTLSGNTFSIDTKIVAQLSDITKLSGVTDILSNNISSLYRSNTANLKFNKHLHINTNDDTEYESLSAFFHHYELGGTTHESNKILNGSIIDVVIDSDDIQITTTDGLSIANGDLIFIHTDLDDIYIDYKDLVIANPIIHSGNVYVIKGGPSKYEFVTKVAELDSKITAETERATEAEAELDKKIEDETARAEAAEQANADAIAAEIARAEAAEAELDSKITAETEARKATDAALSTAIDNKVFINGISAESLSVVNISQDDYHALVDAGTIDSNTIYIVSSDTYNMYDQKIINLAPGTDEKDAVNFGQLSSLSTTIMTEVEAAESELDKKITDEIDRAKAAESELDKKITDEIDRAKAAEQANAKAISDEIVRAEGVEAELRSELDAKSSIYLSSITDNSITCEKLDQLNIVKFNNLNTYNLCCENDSQLVTISDLVLIEEQYLNAEDKRIINVGNPIISSDAANMQYVDNKFNEITNKISTSNILSTIAATKMEDLTFIQISALTHAVQELITILSGL